MFAGYAVPAASFAFASILFRRADDTLVTTLEAGAVTLLALFIALEIRQWSGEGRLTSPANFIEVALHLLTLALQATAYLYLAQRSGRVILNWAWRILGGIALLYGVVRFSS